MTSPDLLNMDLNLLVPLHALLVERNVTRAAERVSVTQAAMSGSLAKLRRLLDDPLLVKDGDQLALTPLAESLQTPVMDVLAMIRATLGRAASFDPAVDSREFTVMASDYAVLVLIRDLVRELASAAPRVRLTVLPLQIERIDLVRRGQCDLMLCAPATAGDGASGFPSVELLTDEFTGVVAADHPDVGDRLTAEQVSTLPYVHVAGFPALPATRRPVATVETFTCAAHLLTGSRMFGLGPRRLLASFGPGVGLRAVDLPVPVPPAVQAVYWHPRFSGDPAHQWLRTMLLERVGR